MPMGSAAYLLDRDALRALNAARATPQGRSLEAVSFMEDKTDRRSSGPAQDRVVGRELRHGDLSPQRTRPAASGRITRTAFLPFAGSGLKVAHLDSGGRSAIRAACLGQPMAAADENLAAQCPGSAGLGAQHARPCQPT